MHLQTVAAYTARSMSLSGFDIQQKVINGLRKANIATSEPSADLVYLNQVTLSGGDGTPLNPPTETITPVLLVDAIFQSYDANLVFDSLIQAGDRRLVTNGLIEIKQNDTFTVGSDTYIAITVDIKEPSGIPLAYIAQLRIQ